MAAKGAWPVCELEAARTARQCVMTADIRDEAPVTIPQQGKRILGRDHRASHFARRSARRSKLSLGQYSDAR